MIFNEHREKRFTLANRWLLGDFESAQTPAECIDLAEKWMSEFDEIQVIEVVDNNTLQTVYITQNSMFSKTKFDVSGSPELVPEFSKVLR